MANPKSYSCELCKKVFTQKCDYTRHKIKKAPCISLEEMEQIAKAKETSNDTKSQLITAFNNCIDIMRTEGLLNEKALTNLSYLLVLNLLEPRFGKEINIDDYEYDFSDIPDHDIEAFKNFLLTNARFSNLTNVKEDNIFNTIEPLWKYILSVHPSTKNIFLKGSGFDIQYKSTFKKLFDKLRSLNLYDVEQDVIGDAYEEIIQKLGETGRGIGQFFTPLLVKKMMVKLINPQIKTDGTIETCCDPTMGTGGFLITYLRDILKQAKAKSIELNWDFIKTQGLYGKELELNTYQFAFSNMLISSGHIFEHLEKGDSIREPITRKFDNVLANPPFGIKGLNYDDFESSLRNEYIPIKTDNAISLFIQAIIYMLKINGKGAVVLPDGQDLFSKTNKTLVAVREYLMKTCDLKEIIYLPSGIFEYTSIKTCVFYFVKKREGTDVLKTKIKPSKTKKENREYDFSDKKHQTSKVAFYEFNPYKDVKNLLVEVPIEKIVNNSYSLNYAEYMKDESVEDKYEEGVVVKTLGEVCSIDYGTRIVRNNNIEGEYPVYGSGRAMFSTETFNRDGFNILIGRFALSLECVRFINQKIFLNDSGLSVKPKTEILLHKYIGYYLLHNQNIIYNCARGTAQKNLEMDKFKSIKIPIPSLEKQKNIVAYLDYIYEKANKTSLTKIEELKQLNEFCLNTQKIFGENSVKELGEVCNFKNGKGIKKDTLVDGEYPVIGGGQKPLGFHNEYNTNENTILCSSSGAYAGFISKYSKKVWASDCFSIMPKENLINNNYLYYLLKSTQDTLYKHQTGAAQPHVYSKDLQSLTILIPSIEKQKEIVAYCDYNCNLIKQLENEIENNKELAQQFIKGIVKNVGVDVDVDELEVEEEESEE